MKKRILVVDDEINICELLKMELEFEGYEVLTCTDGAEAIKLFDANKVDLLLLDVMLPSMNGFDVCKHISAKSDVPVLMLTAKTDIIDKVTHHFGVVHKSHLYWTLRCSIVFLSITHSPMISNWNIVVYFVKTSNLLILFFLPSVINAK
ncbi:MAG: response regulator [Eubacteriaceae bacterium]